MSTPQLTPINGDIYVRENSHLLSKTARGPNRRVVVPFPFMKLPCELRNKVYDELWKSNPTLKVNFWNISTMVCYHGRISVAMHGLPTWLQTCKTFLREGLEELRLNVSWWMDPLVGPNHWYLEGDDPNRINTPILSLAPPRELAIHIGRLHSVHTPSQTVYCLDEFDQADIRAIVERKELLSNAHTVRVECMFADNWDSDEPDHADLDPTLDLGCFEDLPACTRKFELEAYINHELLKESNGYRMKWEHAFGAEVRRVAKTFMKEGVLTVQANMTRKGKPESFLFSFLKEGKEV